MVAVGKGSQSSGSGWAGMRPLLVALLLLADALVVVVLALSQRRGWLPPLIAYGSLLVGLVWFEVWSWRHRHDDD